MKTPEERCMRYLDSEIWSLTAKVKEFGEVLAARPEDASHKMQRADNLFANAASLEICLATKAHMVQSSLPAAHKYLKEELMRRVRSIANHSTSASSNLVEQHFVAKLAQMIEMIEGWLERGKEEIGA